MLQHLRFSLLALGRCSVADVDGNTSNGIGHYQAYRHISLELQLAATTFPGTTATIVDWQRFHDSTSSSPFSRQHGLRAALAQYAYELHQSGSSV